MQDNVAGKHIVKPKRESTQFPSLTLAHTQTPKKMEMVLNRLSRVDRNKTAAIKN